MAIIRTFSAQLPNELLSEDPRALCSYSGLATSHRDLQSLVGSISHYPFQHPVLDASISLKSQLYSHSFVHSHLYCLLERRHRLNTHIRTI